MKELPQDSANNTDDSVISSHAPDSFDDHSKAFQDDQMETFQIALETLLKQHHVNTVAIIAQINDDYWTYSNGHKFDVAVMAGKHADHLRQQLMNELMNRPQGQVT